MSDPQVIQVSIPASPQVVRVIVNNLPRVIRVNVPGQQGPQGATGPQYSRATRYATGTINVNATTDDDIYVGAGVATINLPAASTRTSGRPIVVVDAGDDADTNNKTITPNGAETIRGLSSYKIQFRGGTVELWPRSSSDSTAGAGWYARES